MSTNPSNDEPQVMTKLNSEDVAAKINPLKMEPDPREKATPSSGCSTRNTLHK